MIDTYFKQYFWSFHLLALALAAFLIARTVNAFVSHALSPPAEAIAKPATEASAGKAPPQAESIPIAAFLDRNVFHAAREDLTQAAEEAKENASQESGEFDADNCERSSMAAGLLGTMVAKDDADSIALFEDRGKKEPVLYRIGEKVLDEAELVAIEWRRVLIRHSGRCEFFTLEEEADAGRTTAAVTGNPPAAETAESGAPVETDLGKNIKKVSETEYEIPRQEIEGVLSNLNTVATQARIVPSFHNGKANGFKLFSIRPGSLYSKIGIQNGDIVQRINGYEINSPDKALEIYSKLKDAQSITVDLVRRGKSQTLSYSIR